MRALLQRAVVLTLLVVMVLVTASCGKHNKIVQVSGQVLIDGEPLTHGFVQVAPQGYRPATARIGPDGRFTLTTHGNDDGVVLGTHPVAVIATEPLGAGGQRWHAPREYAAFETSGLNVTINGPTNDLKIELTWNGGKPFVEKFNPE